MRLTTVGDNVIERAVLKTGTMPTPMMDTMVGLLLARTVMAATQAGIFEALASGPLSSEEVACSAGADPRAAGALLFALAGARYVRAKGGRYSLTPMARRWMLRGSPHSIYDAVLHRYLDKTFMEHMEEFLRTGEPLRYHEPGKMTPEQWDIYQRGQHSGALFSAPEVARRIPLPENPQAMLDIGGAHGHYSAAICRRHPGLHSTILDLPEAVEKSRPILEKEGLGDRVRHRAGNALTEDLGTEAYDLIFIANLVHHFDDATNRGLMKRVARALKPGGICVILEIIRSHNPDQAGQISALIGFYFAVISASGTWSFEDLASWQREAGLAVRKPIRLRMTPGLGMQAGRKSQGS